MNVDEAEAGHLKWGIGAIARNHSGDVLAAAAWSTSSARTEARVAECMGVRLGLSFAGDLCFWHVIVESDCLELIKELQSTTSSASYFHSIIRDCQILSGSFQSCEFYHTKRAGNRVTHSLAKYARHNDDSMWIEECPTVMAPLVTDDCNPLILNC